MTLLALGKLSSDSTVDRALISQQRGLSSHPRVSPVK